MRVTVLFFAITKERTGCESCLLTLRDGAKLADARDEILRRFPALVEIQSYLRWAVEQAFVHDFEVVLSDGCEIALIPPVSGGDFTYFTHQAIDVSSVVSEVMAPRNGAVLSFVGTVRNQTDDMHVNCLDYEAYEPMANKVIQNILVRAAESWGGVSVALRHRLGRVEIGGVSLVVAVGSPHRVAAFESLRFIIEELKKDVPIFKKEYRADGTEWVGMGS